MFFVKKDRYKRFSGIIASFLALTLVVSPQFVHAFGTPQLLTDINEAGVSASWGSEGDSTQVMYNGDLYFIASAENESDAYGTELYKTDGTEVGTVLVKDIYEGPGSSYPERLTVANGLLFFTAYVPEYGRELWVTDGTEGGTELVKDIVDGVEDPSLSTFTNFNDLLYFSVEVEGDGDYYDQLWVSDGTEEGTQLAMDPLLVTGPLQYPNLSVVGVSSSTLWLSADDYATGEYILYTDGTQEGTEFIVDGEDTIIDNMYVSTYYGQAENAIVIGETAYFINCAAEGCELWKHATSTGASLILDITEGPDDSYIPVMGALDDTYFYMDVCPNDYNCNPWISDGTAEGTEQLAVINEGGESDPNFLGVSEGKLFFDGYNGDDLIELWYTTGATTSRIYTFTDEESGDWDHEDSAGVANGMLFISFCEEDSGIGCELYKTKSDLSGIELVADIREGSRSSAPANITAFGSGILFQARTDVEGDELWFSDGTEGGTVLVADMFTGTIGIDDESEYIVATDTHVFFIADTIEYGEELWVTDGTEEGTMLVKDIVAGSGGSNLNEEAMIATSDKVFFRAYHPDYGEELWVSDGTEGGTVLVKDIYAGGDDGSYPEDFVVSGDVVYFSANDGTHGEELWVSDGTAEGTFMVADINEGGNSSYVDYLFAASDGRVYFQAYTDEYAYELWVSDGTEEGTMLVKDIALADASGSASEITEVGDEIYFIASDQSELGSVIWKTDGTTEGTVVAVNANPEYLYESYYELTAFDGKLYFSSSDGENGYELWVYDGESAAMVMDINNGSGDSAPSEFVAGENYLFFVASDGVQGSELWRTDGTSEGTIMLGDIYDGENSSSPENMIAAGQYVFFGAYTPLSGEELWVSDGTAEGTELVYNINQADTLGDDDSIIEDSSEPGNLVAFNGKLFFYAEEPNYGREIYVLQDAYDFDEESSEPTVTTQAASSITRTGATLNGTLEDLGTVESTAWGFEYGRTTSYGTDAIVGGGLLETGPFYVEVSGLTCGTTYNYRALIVTESATSTGNNIQFKTSACASSGGGGGTAAAVAKNVVENTTPTDNATVLATLRAQLAALMAKLAALTGETTAPVQGVRDLELNAEGTDVQMLQQLLIAQGYAIPAGATGFFGTQTQSALAKYQQANGITPASGYFGEKTRAQMKAAGFSGLWW